MLMQREWVGCNGIDSEAEEDNYIYNITNGLWHNVETERIEQR